MPSAVDRFRAAAQAAGIDVDPRHFPAGTRTAADAAAAIGCEVSQIVKSLVFVADGEPVVALTSGANRVDTARLAEVADATEVRKADADEVRAATGFAIGGTPPFGYARRLTTYLDRDLLAHDTVYAAAGTPETNFAVATRRLAELPDVVVADLAT